MSTWDLDGVSAGIQEMKKGSRLAIGEIPKIYERLDKLEKIVANIELKVGILYDFHEGNMRWDKEQLKEQEERMEKLKKCHMYGQPSITSGHDKPLVDCRYCGQAYAIDNIDEVCPKRCQQ